MSAITQILSNHIEIRNLDKVYFRHLAITGLALAVLSGLAISLYQAQVAGIGFGSTVAYPLYFSIVHHLMIPALATGVCILSFLIHLPSREPVGRGITPEIRGSITQARVCSPTMGKCELQVQVGQEVEASTVVCIVEVMKMQIAIPAGQRGRIDKIFVSDGAIIEQGTPIVSLEPR